MIIVACGFDAAMVDPLARMQANADTFAEMTRAIKETAQELCGGKLVLVHEGGYSEFYVPFCGHATIAALAGVENAAPDPMKAGFDIRQPTAEFDAFLKASIDKNAEKLGL